eukprot:Rhum_TRINITY_DN14356_c4_g1::Rhum_TRINITY_DN14356_c4_g1_i1::g.84568::m.84568
MVVTSLAVSGEVGGKIARGGTQRVAVRNLCGLPGHRCGGGLCRVVRVHLGLGGQKDRCRLSCVCRRVGGLGEHSLRGGLLLLLLQEQLWLLLLRRLLQSVLRRSSHHHRGRCGHDRHRRRRRRQRAREEHGSVGLLRCGDGGDRRCLLLLLLLLRRLYQGLGVNHQRRRRRVVLNSSVHHGGAGVRGRRRHGSRGARSAYGPAGTRAAVAPPPQVVPIRVVSIRPTAWTPLLRVVATVRSVGACDRLRVVVDGRHPSMRHARVANSPALRRGCQHPVSLVPAAPHLRVLRPLLLLRLRGASSAGGGIAEAPVVSSGRGFVGARVCVRRVRRAAGRRAGVA